MTGASRPTGGPQDIAAPLLTGTLERLARPGRRPFVLGVAGAQGSGKSTVAARLGAGLRAAGRTAAVLSIDDIYLPRQERERLARRVHPLLRTRGPPGTHEVPLGLALIEGLGRAERVRLPRFDKAADTRRPPAEWDLADGPVDVLVLEGWCVGARPQADAELAAPCNALERDEDPDGRWRRWVNAQLHRDYGALFGRIDMLAFLAAPNFEVVADWRIEQEAELRRRQDGSAAPSPGLMSNEQVRRFIQFYERLTRHMLVDAPRYADLVIALDDARRPVSVRRASV